MHKLTAYFLHWKLVLLVLLKPLGFWGVGILAVIDTSSIAIPMDLIVAGYVWNDPRHFWIYAVMAAVGSAVGGLLPFYIGRAGGEWVLTKRMEPAKYEQMRARFDRHHWFAVAVPAMMPPPFPFKLFAFGAGVFEMRVLPYMAAVLIGRTIHYMATALLVIWFGPKIFDLILHGAKQRLPLVLIVVALLTVGFLFTIFHRHRQRRRTLTEAA